MATKSTSPTPAPQTPFRIVADSVTQAFSRAGFGPPAYVRLPDRPETFPTTYPALAALVKQYQGFRYHPRLAAEDRDWLRELLKRTHAAQQVPRYEVDQQQAGRDLQTAITESERDRLRDRQALEAAIAADWKDEPLAPLRPLPPPLEAFINSDGLGPLRALRAAAARFQTRWAAPENFALHSPAWREQERRNALNSSPTPEQAKVCMDEAAMTKNPHFGQLRNNAVAELDRRYHETVRPLEIAAIESCIAFLTAAKQDSVEAERNFFESAGLPHETTAVSKQFDGLLADMQHRLTLLTKGPGA